MLKRRVIHVIPNADTQQHYETAHCDCRPTCDPGPPGADPIYLHHAFDRRELYERAHGTCISPSKTWSVVTITL